MHLTRSFELEINWGEAPYNYLKHCLQFDMKREPREQLELIAFLIYFD